MRLIRKETRRGTLKGSPAFAVAGGGAAVARGRHREATPALHGAAWDVLVVVYGAAVVCLVSVVANVFGVDLAFGMAAPEAGEPWRRQELLSARR